MIVKYDPMDRASLGEADRRLFDETIRQPDSVIAFPASDIVYIKDDGMMRHYVFMEHEGHLHDRLHVTEMYSAVRN